MFEKKYSKFLTILLVIIIVAIIALGGYLGYNYYRNYSTKNDANQYVSTFVEEVGETKDTNISDTNSTISDDISSTEMNSYNGAKKKYKGWNVLGTIEIPKTNVKYPVLEPPATPKSLDIAVVALYPEDAVLNTVGNIVIVGHNYRNGTFFSNNKKLAIGDKIYITDLNGKKVTYVIYETFETELNDTSSYNRDTDGKMEITLSTCTDASNDQRLLIKARAE